MDTSKNDYCVDIAENSYELEVKAAKPIVNYHSGLRFSKFVFKYSCKYTHRHIYITMNARAKRMEAKIKLITFSVAFELLRLSAFDCRDPSMQLVT